MNSQLTLALESHVARHRCPPVTMKSLRFAVVSLLLAAVPAVAEEAPIKSAFGPGEQANYVIYFAGVPTGEFSITVGMLMKREGKEVWPFLCLAKTEIPIYTINDKYVAYWDFRAQEHVGSDFWIDENKKKRREHVTMKRPESKALVKRANIGEQLHEVSYDIDPTALDVSSATMWLRNIPLKVGDKYSRPVFTGAVAFIMHAEVLEKVTLDTKPFGQKEAFKLRVSTEFAGQLKQKRDLIAYMSADKLQVVLRMEADFLLGQITADLVSFEPGKDFTRG